ncbi:MAG: NADH-quinone oxidoreductase subunit M [Bacteroidota bacterium]|nr:NADH-quinone oxidoreductase subunit M [Bacteroidota bacterium]
MFPALSFLLFFPLFVSIVLLFIPGTYLKLIRTIAISSCAILLAFVIFLLQSFDPQLKGFQFFEKFDWITLTLPGIGRLSVDYCLGVDGVSLVLLFLTTVVFLIAIIISNSITERFRAYYAATLFLYANIIGCFIALDLFLFFLFFELMLLPMYFLIGIWGGPRKEYAAIKFFLYTLFGSVFILIALIMLYISYKDPIESSMYTLTHTFRLDYFTNASNILSGSVLALDYKGSLWGFNYREWAFLLLFLGFCIKLPSFPFHTWLPDAHVEAPTPVSIILAAILLKVGAYGLFRIAYPIFPTEAAHFANLIAIIGTISIVYAAYNALAQTDIKKMIAYSSVSHMGFVILGLASNKAEGIGGAIYQMVSHGFISAGLFLIAGVLYDRTHNRQIENFRGLANKMPRFTAFVIILFFASFGLPGFSGFIAEILVLLGSFSSVLIPKWVTLTALVGLVVAAAYYLWTLQRMFFGKYWVQEGLLENKEITDLNNTEMLCFIPLVFFVILLGIYPDAIFYFVSNTIAPF